MKQLPPFLGASALAIIALACSVSSSAQAAYSTVITLDENGNSRVMSSFFTDTSLTWDYIPDPVPGGAAVVFGYYLPNPSNPVLGDLEITDGSQRSDLLRFVPETFGAPAAVLFYSDTTVAPGDALADLLITGRPPPPLQSNNISLAEVGPEGANGLIYTPTPTEPGYIAGANVTYDIISDSAVPEPTTWAMLVLGLGASGAVIRRARSKPRPLQTTFR